MQEIVDESADIEIRPESQHNPGQQSDFAEVLQSYTIYEEVNKWLELLPEEAIMCTSILYTL